MLSLLIEKGINFINAVFWQGVRFAFVGLFNTLFDYSIYIALTRLTDYFGIHYLQANAISFGSAVILSYFLNKHWTFKDKSAHSLRQFIKFVLVIAIGSFVLVQLILYISVEIWQIYDLIGKLFGVIIGFIWNFFMSRKLVFKM